MEQFRVTPEAVLDDTMSFDERLARTPAEYTIKGLFFRSAVEALGPEVVLCEPQLSAPPPLGGYSAIADYSQRDHAVLAAAAARKLYPQLSLREGLRRMERGAAHEFAESSVGRVIVRFASSPTSAFQLLPRIFTHVQKGGVMQVRLRQNGVCVECREFAPWLDCSVIGALEGVVVLFGKRPTVDVKLISAFDADYDIDWS